MLRCTLLRLGQMGKSKESSSPSCPLLTLALYDKRVMLLSLLLLLLLCPKDFFPVGGGGNRMRAPAYKSNVNACRKEKKAFVRD